MQPKPNTKPTLGPLSRKEVREIAGSMRKGKGGIIVLPFKNGVRQTPMYLPAYSAKSSNALTLERVRQTLIAMGCEDATSIDASGKAKSILAP